jgi:hypothetical protein
MTEARERKFWKKHSIADYWKDLRESDDTFERPRLTPVTVKFDPLVLRKIKMLARKRGNLTTLTLDTSLPEEWKTKLVSSLHTISRGSPPHFRY